MATFLGALVSVIFFMTLLLTVEPMPPYHHEPMPPYHHAPPPQPHGKETTYFKYDFTRQKPTHLTYEGDAHFTTNPTVLRLTETDASGIPQPDSLGRVVYKMPVTMYERGRQASFESTIRFLITPYSGACGPADGLAFFIEPVGYPVGEGGGSFGVLDSTIPNSRVLAVAFDTYSNEGEPSSPHVEIDIGSITSKSVTEVGDELVGREVYARITYDATTNLIKVVGTAGSTTFKVEYLADLSTVFPQKVQVGLSATTGGCVAVFDVLSWSFYSRLVRAY